MSINIFEVIQVIADEAVADGDFSSATFDQLAEEVMELHLALRGKHKDTPAMEWIEIATIAINAIRLLPESEVVSAAASWFDRHDPAKANSVNDKDT